MPYSPWWAMLSRPSHVPKAKRDRERRQGRRAQADPDPCLSRAVGPGRRSRAAAAAAVSPAVGPEALRASWGDQAQGHGGDAPRDPAGLGEGEGGPCGQGEVAAPAMSAHGGVAAGARRPIAS